MEENPCFIIVQKKTQVLLHFQSWTSLSTDSGRSRNGCIKPILIVKITMNGRSFQEMIFNIVEILGDMMLGFFCCLVQTAEQFSCGRIFFQEPVLLN